MSEFKSPSSVAINRQNGNIFITDRGNNRVQVFDKYGDFLTQFGTKGSKNGQFSGPEGIVIDPSGIVFIADSDNHRIQLFDPNCMFIGKFGSKGNSKNHPRPQPFFTLLISDKHDEALVTRMSRSNSKCKQHSKLTSLVNSPFFLNRFVSRHA